MGAVSRGQMGRNTPMVLDDPVLRVMRRAPQSTHRSTLADVADWQGSADAR